MLLVVILALYASLVSASGPARFGCLNSMGNHVDWWIIYKEYGSERYIYKDPHTELHLHDSRLIGHANSPLVRTVKSSGFSDTTSRFSNGPFYISWNDQPTKGENAGLEFAHAKGFMGLKNTGYNLVESFFIQHSLPRFPMSRDSLFDTNISKRAQHFVCVSMRDEFTGQGNGEEKKKNIQIDSVQDCNFFKLLWHYARNVNVKFFDAGFGLNHTQIKMFKEILIALPNYPIARTDGVVGTVPRSLNLTSFTIESTGNEENRLIFQIFAKAPDYNIDIYDDVTALFSIHHDDYNPANTSIESLKTANFEGKSSMIMIAQSHSDPATLGINAKTLVDRENFFATVHVLNSSHIKLPVQDAEPPVIIESMYRDHSKWSINLVYGTEGDFPPLLCFYDLNRSTKQAKRGGGAFCLNSSVTGSSPASLSIWKLFMTFQPDPNSMARFNNADINVTLGQVLPNTSSESVAPTPSASPLKSGATTRGYRERKRRNSIGDATQLKKFNSPTLTKAEFSTENNLVKFFYPNSLSNQPSCTVPCPYKFTTNRSRVKLSRVVTRTVLAITMAVQRHGFTILNNALVKDRLKIIPLDDFLPTPSKVNAPNTPSDKRVTSLNSDYNFGTVIVPRKIGKAKSPLRSSSAAYSSSTKTYTSLRSNLKKSASPGSNVKKSASPGSKSNIKKLTSPGSNGKNITSPGSKISSPAILENTSPSQSGPMIKKMNFLPLSYHPNQFGLECLSSNKKVARSSRSDQESDFDENNFLRKRSRTEAVVEKDDDDDDDRLEVCRGVGTDEDESRNIIANESYGGLFSDEDHSEFKSESKGNIEKLPNVPKKLSRPNDELIEMNSDGGGFCLGNDIGSEDN